MLKIVLKSLSVIAFSLCARNVSAQQDASYKTYKVEKGDNFYKISKKFKCSVNDIQKANDNKTVIKAGETIRIPIKSSAGDAVNIPSDSPEAYQEHIVAKGDNMGKIASRYGTTIYYIKKLNGLSGDLLKIGQKLKVPALPKSAEKPAESVSKPVSESNTGRTKDSATKKPMPPSPRVPVDVNPGMPEKTVAVMNDFVTEKEETAMAKVVKSKMEDTRTHVMHPTLPKGNIIVVYNPESGRMAYCKVVDNYTPRQYEGSGLIMTPAVADKIGLSSNVASVKIKYAAP